MSKEHHTDLGVYISTASLYGQTFFFYSGLHMVLIDHSSGEPGRVTSDKLPGLNPPLLSEF
jgi:hypothetical protein